MLQNIELVQKKGQIGNKTDLPLLVNLPGIEPN